MKLTEAEIKEVAQKFDIDPKLLYAVSVVESGGSGFLPDNRLKILFERHYMWKRLEARAISPKSLASDHPGLCSKAGGGYGKGGVHQWDRLSQILDWSKTNAPEQFESYKKSAYESCSWGAFQIMGANYQAAGFDNVYDLKHHLEKGNKEQLETACEWMKRNGLLKRLKDKNWAGFARGYNGPGYAKNRYDTKLEDAYENCPF